MGSTIKTIGLPFFKKLKITYPQFFEQQKIAHILTTWDAAITCTQKLLENSKQQKKALMQQLLTGRRRLPGFSKNWQKIKLGKLFSRVTTRNSEKCTTVVTISAQQGLIRQEDFFSKAVASSTLDNYFLIKNGEFAYNKSYSKGYPFGAIKRLNKYELGVVTSLYICFSLHAIREAVRARAQWIVGHLREIETRRQHGRNQSTTCKLRRSAYEPSAARRRHHPRNTKYWPSVHFLCGGNNNSERSSRRRRSDIRRHAVYPAEGAHRF